MGLEVGLTDFIQEQERSTEDEGYQQQGDQEGRGPGKFPCGRVITRAVGGRALPILEGHGRDRSGVPGFGRAAGISSVLCARGVGSHYSRDVPSRPAGGAPGSLKLPTR